MNLTVIGLITFMCGRATDHMNLAWQYADQPRRTKMKYKIEKNIPISKHGKTGKWSSIENQMEVGDSILLSNRKEAQGISTAFKRKGYKALTRKVDNGIRVWKVER
jgi:hypothetical protein